MKPSKSYLLWECIPLWSGVLLFAGMSAVNWDYARKLVTLTNGSWVGPVLLGVSIFVLCAAAFPLLVCRRMWESTSEGVGFKRTASLATMGLAFFKTVIGWAIMLAGPSIVAMIQS
jgi:hypothetical protein